MKITYKQLRQLVREEMDKLVSTEERVEDEAQEDVAPEDMADTLAKQMDMLKALKIEEARLSRKLTENKAKQKSLVSKSKK